MPRPTLASRLLGSTPFVLILFVATVVPAIGFVASSDARRWIDANGYVVFWCAFAICILLVVALELQRREVEPDARDAELADRFRREFGADSTAVTWLRNDFAPNRFSQDKWHALEQLYLTWSDDDARRFRDKKVQGAYETCMSSLGVFVNRVGDDTWARDTRESDPGAMGLPAEWRYAEPEMQKRWQTAVDEIAETRRTFLKAHSDFLKKAHGRGL